MIGFQNVVSFPQLGSIIHLIFPPKKNTMKYELRKDLTSEAIRLTIRSFLMDLGNMNVDDLTTFELHFLRALAENAPDKKHGTDWPIE